MAEFFSLFVALIVAAITYGTPLLFGTLGEILTEKSGNLNLGVEGIMFMGGAIGLGGVFYYEKAVGTPNADSGHIDRAALRLPGRRFRLADLQLPHHNPAG